MKMENKRTDELVSIAAAGGGMRLDGSFRPTSELVQIANAASQKGARLIITGLDTRRTDELVQIASAGKGSVMFE